MFKLKDALKNAWTEGFKGAGDVQKFVEKELQHIGSNAEVVFTCVTDAADNYIGLKFALMIDGKILSEDNCVLPCDRYFWDNDGVILGPSFTDAANLLSRCLDHVPEELRIQGDKILFNLNR